LANATATKGDWKPFDLLRFRVIYHGNIGPCFAPADAFALKNLALENLALENLPFKTWL
jgi:hypothetical protein